MSIAEGPRAHDTQGSALSGLGIEIPQDIIDGMPDASAIQRYVKTADDQGFESLWVLDNAAQGVLSPLEALAFAASATARPRLGVAVLLSALRSPLHLARALATVDHLSGGRLVVGIGLGADKDSYARHGLPAKERAKRFEAGAVALRRLLTDDVTSYEQPWWTLNELPRPLAPLQRPCPPIWFGAQRGAALDRAVRLGDGWIGAGSSSSADFEQALEHVERMLAESGKRRNEFTVAKRVYVQLGDETPDAALRQWFHRHYGNQGLANRVICGSAVVVVKHLTQLRALGTDMLILHPVLDMQNQLHRLADNVLPHVPPPKRRTG